MSGRFYVIEGLDGSGGTTQVVRLAERLRAEGREVVVTREPSPGPIGRFVRKLIAEEEVGDAPLPYLFAADRRDHLDRVVLPALGRDADVVCDRYALSSLAYQAPNGLGLGLVVELNRRFPRPDLTIVLDLDVETCVARIVARGGAVDRFEQAERLRQVRLDYDQAISIAADAWGWPIVRIAASHSVEVVAAAVRAAVDVADRGMG